MEGTTTIVEDENEIASYLDEFKSNLMLLVHNLYPDGLPLSRLDLEYHRYFKQNVKMDKLRWDIGVPPHLEDGKWLWPYMFSEPALRTHFNLFSNYNGGEKVIKCIRGRVASEMKILAQIASYKNMLKNREFIEDTENLPICHKCMAACPISEASNPPDTHLNYQTGNVKEEMPINFANEKLPQFETTEITLNSKISKTAEETDPNPEETDVKRELIQFPDENDDNRNLERSPPVVLPGVTIADSSSAIFDSFEYLNSPSPYTDESDSHPKMTPLTSSEASFGYKEGITNQSQQHEDVDSFKVVNSSKLFKKRVSRPRPSKILNSGDRKGRGIGTVTVVKEAATNVSTSVLVNHLGEVKVIKFLSVEQTCSFCGTSISDEIAYNSHIRICTSQRYMCLKCESKFATLTQLRGHRLLCHTKGSKASKRSATTNEPVKNNQNTKMPFLGEENSIVDNETAVEIVVKDEIDL